jgi:hypothetical protein
MMLEVAAGTLDEFAFGAWLAEMSKLRSDGAPAKGFNRHGERF